jgi:bacitracin synthase 3
MTKNTSKGFILQSKQVKNEKNYWMNKLSGQLMKTYFPYDYVTPVDFTGNTDNVHFDLPGDLFTKLMQLARGSDNNLYIVLLTGLNILLNKYTGNKDIITAIPIYKQEIEGEFINTALAIRFQLTGQETVKELMMQGKKTVFEANENLNFPIERLINQHLDIPSAEDGLSLLETVVILDNIHHKKYINHLKPNILFSFLKTEKKITGCLEYNSQLYTKNTIERIVGHFIYLMQIMLNNLDQQVSRLEILAGEERRRILETINKTGMNFPKERTIHELFEQQAEKSGSSIAVVGDGSPAPLTYRELNEKANQLARFFIEKGVKPGTITAVMTSPSVKTMIAILAVLKAGGAYLPIDPQFPRERIDYMIKDSQARIILAYGDNIGQFEDVGQLIDIDDDTIYTGAVENLVRYSTPLDILYVIYTSGTSGRPKGVLIKNENMVNYVSWFINIAALTGKDKTMLLSSFAFDLGYTSVYSSILAGGELHIMAKEMFLSPGNLLDYLEEKGITYLKMTPSLFSVIAAGPGFSKEKCPLLRLVLLGGEPINTADVDHAHNVCPHLQIMNHYGPTETTIGSIARFIDFNHLDEYKQKPTIGRPIANTQVYIMDDYLNPVPANVPGELCIGGNGVAAGYLNQPKLTAEKFIQLKGMLKIERHETAPQQINKEPIAYVYRTGDMARWTLDGNIEFLGRRDKQVKIRGFRIELEEIENQLARHPFVNNAVVIVREDDNDSKYLCAYYVSQSPIEVTQLREFLAPKLHAYMIPSFFIQLEKIPVTANGKLDLQALPEPVPGEDIDYRPPQNRQQEKLVVLWGEVLGLNKDNIGIDANFFELGGDSLRATTLIAKIHKEYDAQVPLLEFFKIPTIKGLSDIISRSKENKYTFIQPAEEKEYYPVSSVQRRLYLLQQIEDFNTAYNLPFVISLEGQPDLNKFKYAFDMLVSRHESLRTSFELVDEELVQRIHKEVDFDFQYLNSSSENHSVEGFIQDIIRPFDLSCPPLIRAGLIKTAANKYIFWVDMHHILRDGQSEKLLKNEFLSLYAGEELPPMRLHYKDYAEWQNGPWMQETLKRQEKFWQKEFAGEIPVLNLPTDYQRPANQSFAGNSIFFQLDETGTTALNRIARTEGTTLFMTLLALYYVFLSKISHQDDIVVGTPIAARTHADLENIIGMFVNTLSIRTACSQNSSFKDLLSSVKDKAIQAFDNQDYSFEKLVESVAVERDLSRNPLFDVMFVLQNIAEVTDDSSAKNIENLLLEPYTVEKKTSKFDLSLMAVEGDNKLKFYFEYCTKLFKDETIWRFINYFKNILSCIIANPNTIISRIEIIPNEEKEQILFQFNDTVADYPQDKTIHQLFEEQVQRTPEQEALLGQCSNKTQVPTNDTSISYRELNEKSNRLTDSLKTNGVQKETIVGIMVDRSLEMIIGIMGILKAGGAYLPIAPDYPEERKRYMLEDSGANILLTSEQIADLSMSKTLGVNSNDDSSHPSSPPLSATALAYVIYTSGSTGRPKGVMIQHASVVNRLHWMQRYYPLGQDDIILQKTPYTFDVSVWELFWWSFYGARLCLLGPGEEKDPSAITQSIEQYHITTMHFVPSMLGVFLDYLESSNESHRCNSLCHVFSSGEALGVHQVERFYQLLQTRKNPGIRLINLYGPTEATVDVTYYNCVANDQCQTIPIGKPIDNTSLYILDKQMILQPIGIPGELCIAGTGLARGYLNRPELTAEKFVTNHLSQAPLYRTGDLARWLPDGNIEFLGRIDQQIKIRGYRIELGEIKHQLLKHDDIKDAVVLVKGENRTERYLCAYYVSHKKTVATGLSNYLAKNLPDYMIPSHFLKVEQIPITANGKVDIQALPEPVYDGEEGSYVAPRNFIQHKLLEIWSKLLHIEEEKISIDENFFKLGGNSLNATLMANRIHKDLSVKISVREIFATPQISLLSKHIESMKVDKYTSMEVSEEKSYYDLSHAQKRLWMLSNMESGTETYNVTNSYMFKGTWDREIFKRVFYTLIQRHEALRTTFTVIDDNPKMNIHSTIDFKLEELDLSTKSRADNLIEHYSKEVFMTTFDLEKGPLFRVKILNLNEDSHLIIYAIHHIICDFISLDILSREMETLYNSYREGEDNPLITLKFQYKDYVTWETNILEENSDRLKAFWDNHLQGGIEALNLPIDKSRPTMKTFNGAATSFKLEKQLSVISYDLASEYNVSLYTLYLSIFNVFMSKLCRQDNITLIFGISGRDAVDLENIIGIFVRPIFIKNTVTAEKKFSDFLMEVSERVLAAMDHSIYPYEQLVNEYAAKGEQRNIVTVHFNAISPLGPTPEEITPETEEQQSKFESKLSKDDLTFQMVETTGQLHFNVEFNTDLFSELKINLLIAWFKNITQQILSLPKEQILSYYLEHGREDELYRFLGVSNQEFACLYPLTPTQRDLYLDCLINPDGKAHRLFYYNQINQPIDINVHKQTLTILYKNYPILRSKLLTRGEEIYLGIRNQMDIQLDYIDLSDNNQTGNLSKTDIEEKLQEITASTTQNLDQEFICHYLIKISDTLFINMVSAHHIVFDGLSGKMMFEKLHRYYGEYETLSKETVPHEVYLNFSRTEIKRFDTRAVKSFWEDKFSTLQMLERNTSKNAPNRFVENKVVVDDPHLEQITAYCKANSISTALYFRSVYSLLIRLYSGVDGDFLIREIVDNRDEITGNVMGCFYQVVPMVLENHAFTGESSVESYFKYVRSRKKEMGTNQYITVLLQNQLTPEEDIIFYFNYSTFFTLDVPGNQSHLIKLEHEPNNTHANIFGKEVHLRAAFQEQGFRLDLNYNETFFNGNRFLERLLHVSRQIIEKQSCIGDLDFLMAEEKENLLYFATTGTYEYPTSKTIHQLFEEQAEKTPTNTAIIFENESLTYNELHRLSSQLARYLRTQQGIRPGTLVGMLLERSEKMIICILAILKAGGAYVPLDINYPTERISFTLHDSAVKVVLVENRTTLAHHDLSGDRFISLEHIGKEIETFDATPLVNENQATDPAYVIYTSGSTGKPKGVVVEHRNLVRLFFNSGFSFDFSSSDTWTLYHSYCFDFSVWEMYGALLYGGKLIVVPLMTSKDSELFFQVLQDQKVTVLNQTPQAFYGLIEAMEHKEDHLHIKYVIFGGEALNPGKLKKWNEKYPHSQLINMFGITETTVHVTYKEITGSEINANISNIGKPIPTLSTYIMDRNLNLQPKGLAGEICVGGEGVARGYMNRPQLTSEKFVKNPYNREERLYRSGDLGRFLDDGDMEYLGRIDNQVKIRGYRIELGEIENRLIKHEYIKEAVVLSRSDDGQDKQLCAYIALEEGNEIDIPGIKEYLAKTLPTYMIPPYFFQIPRIPLTSSGKIDRKALYSIKMEIKTGVEYAPPTNEVEEKIAAIWQEVLKLDEAGIHDNFFDLGGNSLNMVTVKNKIKTALDENVPLIKMFVFPTIKSLANYLKEEETNTGISDEEIGESVEMMEETMQMLLGE